VTDWDAASYDRLADPQEEWGREVLTRLELRGVPGRWGRADAVAEREPVR